MKLVKFLAAILVIEVVAATKPDIPRRPGWNFEALLDASKKMQCYICHHIVKHRHEWEKTVSEDRVNQLMRCDLVFKEQDPRKPFDGSGRHASLMACHEFLRQGYAKQIIDGFAQGNMASGTECSQHCG